jgi:hypothetical protein
MMTGETHAESNRSFGLRQFIGVIHTAVVDCTETDAIDGNACKNWKSIMAAV